MAKLSERIQQQQARRARQPLPPSHPRGPANSEPTPEEDNPSAQVIDLTQPADSAHGAEVDRDPAVETVPDVLPESSPDKQKAPKTVTAAVGERSTPRRKPKARSEEADVAIPLEPRQVWLDRQNDLWLSECEYANVRRGGRKVISRSSVVRLALDRLREAMTPEEITDLLAGREPVQTGRGRPRR